MAPTKSQSSVSKYVTSTVQIDRVNKINQGQYHYGADNKSTMESIQSITNNHSKLAVDQLRGDYLNVNKIQKMQKTLEANSLKSSDERFQYVTNNDNAHEVGGNGIQQAILQLINSTEQGDGLAKREILQIKSMEIEEAKTGEKVQPLSKAINIYNTTYERKDMVKGGTKRLNPSNLVQDQPSSNASSSLHHDFKNSNHDSTRNHSFQKRQSLITSNSPIGDNKQGPYKGNETSAVNIQPLIPRNSDISHEILGNNNNLQQNIVSNKNNFQPEENSSNENAPSEAANVQPVDKVVPPEGESTKKAAASKDGVKHSNIQADKNFISENISPQEVNEISRQGDKVVYQENQLPQEDRIDDANIKASEKNEIVQVQPAHKAVKSEHASSKKVINVQPQPAKSFISPNTKSSTENESFEALPSKNVPQANDASAQKNNIVKPQPSKSVINADSKSSKQYEIVEAQPVNKVDQHETTSSKKVNIKPQSVKTVIDADSESGKQYEIVEAQPVDKVMDSQASPQEKNEVVQSSSSETMKEKAKTIHSSSSNATQETGEGKNSPSSNITHEIDEVSEVSNKSVEVTEDVEHAFTAIQAEATYETITLEFTHLALNRSL